MGKVSQTIRFPKVATAPSSDGRPPRQRRLRLVAVGAAATMVLSTLVVVVGIPGIDSPAPAAAADTLILVDGPGGDPPADVSPRRRDPFG